MRRRGRSGWTLLETLIVLGILVCVFFMLLPAIQAAREASRRIACHNNLKQIGLGLHGYGQVFKVLPASAGVTRGDNGRIASIGGPSFLAAILPYMTEANARGAVASDRYPWLLCPSYDGSPWANPATKEEAIANYRPIGATHIESLSVASPNPMTPKYDADPRPSPRRARHPDGTFFPGSYLTFGDLRRGMSNIIFIVESVEPRFARWTVGSDAAVVGAPRNVEFEEGEDWERYYLVPKGHGEAIKGKDDSVYWTYRTYLNWDYDQSPYDGADGTVAGRFGPSSNHSTIVTHLFGDGSCRALVRSIDISFYLYLLRPD